MKAASACQSLPLVNGVTVSEYCGLIRLPATIGSPTWSFGSAYLDFLGVVRVSQVPDASLHAYRALKWTPTDPQESRLLLGFSCVGFPSVNTVAVCT